MRALSVNIGKVGEKLLVRDWFYDVCSAVLFHDTFVEMRDDPECHINQMTDEEFAAASAHIRWQMRTGIVDMFEKHGVRDFDDGILAFDTDEQAALFKLTYVGSPQYD